MQNDNLTRTRHLFWKQILTKYRISNNIFIINVEQTTYYIQSKTIIEWIQNSSLKEQEYAERLLRLYDLQNRDINKCLEEIATDYIMKNYTARRNYL